MFTGVSTKSLFFTYDFELRSWREHVLLFIFKATNRRNVSHLIAFNLEDNVLVGVSVALEKPIDHWRASAGKTRKTWIFDYVPFTERVKLADKVTSFPTRTTFFPHRSTHGSMKGSCGGFWKGLYSAFKILSGLSYLGLGGFWFIAKSLVW